MGQYEALSGVCASDDTHIVDEACFFDYWV